MTFPSRRTGSIICGRSASPATSSTASSLRAGRSRGESKATSRFPPRPGRWNPEKTPIVYCADDPATALLEMLMHIDPEDAPSSYQLLRIEASDSITMYQPKLPSGWQEDLVLTRGIGRDFITDQKAAVMSVPCVVAPFTTNYLLNPSLVETSGIRIAEATRHLLDRRMLGLRSLE